MCESTLGSTPPKTSPFGLKSAAAPISRETKKKLAVTPPPDPIEYHSDEDMSRFISVVLAALGPDDRDASLLLIIEEESGPRTPSTTYGDPSTRLKR